MKNFFEKFNGKLMRLWHRGEPEGETCDYVFLIDYFEMPDGRVLVEYRNYDERYPDNQYPYSNFRYFDELIFAYAEADEADI